MSNDYFSYRFPRSFQAFQNQMMKVPFLRSIVEWIVHFIVQHVAGWIIERGGWVTHRFIFYIVYSGPCDFRALYLTILCILRPDMSDTTCIYVKPMDWVVRNCYRLNAWISDMRG